MNQKINKIFEIPKKIPIYSLIAALSGILVLIFGDGGADAAMLITGILLAIYSLLRIAGVFLLDDSRTGAALTLLFSVGVLLLAVSLIADPAASYGSLSQLAGLYLALEGGIGLLRLSLYRSPTYLRVMGKAPLSRISLAIVATLYTVTLALGAYLLYFSVSNSSHIPCAVILIISGASSTAAAILKNRAKPSATAPRGDYIEAEFTDKTDEE